MELLAALTKEDPTCLNPSEIEGTEVGVPCWHDPCWTLHTNDQRQKGYCKVLRLPGYGKNKFSQRWSELSIQRKGH